MSTRSQCPICGCFLASNDSGEWRCSGCGTEGDAGLPESFVRAAIGLPAERIAGQP